MSQNCHLTVDFFKLGPKQGLPTAFGDYFFWVYFNFNNCYFPQNMPFFFFLKKPGYLPVEFSLCWIWLIDYCWLIYLFVYLSISCMLYFLYAGRWVRGLISFRYAAKNTSMWSQVLHFSLSKTGQVRLRWCQPDPTTLKLLIYLPGMVLVAVDNCVLKIHHLISGNHSLQIY